MKRWAVFTYGVAAYVVFLGTFLYALGFVGNVFVPKSMDSARNGTLATAFAIDIGLLTLFAVQHSVMARRGFKSWLTRLVPEAAERSTYVLASSVALILLFAFWRPLGGPVWEVTDPLGRAILVGLFAFGWSLVLVTTFLINHFDLFGLRQVWFYLKGRPYKAIAFRTPGPYRFVRHPLYVGWLFAFWATPTMTVTHLVFAVMTTAYILVAIQLEERDLVNTFGATYADYRRRVPMLVPGFAKGAGASVAGEETLLDVRPGA
jgi:protein-S-isoprenylcysteine O-methyltransferase Ste14